MIASREFREDLFYRLNVFPIPLPPLRERRDDIPLLVRYFTQKYARRMNRRIETIPSEAMEALTNWNWPGNVRELENFIERAVILTRGSALHVPLAELRNGGEAAPPTVTGALTTLEEAEREHILRALQECKWVVGGPAGAAARLGLKRTTLQSRMQKLGIVRRS
jgi:formate hydrogenlyase transcriptional activator